MADWDFVFTPDDQTVAAVTWSEDTSWQMAPAGRRLHWYQYQGIDGEDGLDSGWIGASGQLTTWISGTTEAALQTTINTATALVGEVGSLSIRGGATGWSHAVMSGPPLVSDHYVDANTGYPGCKMVLSFKQLAPN